MFKKKSVVDPEERSPPFYLWRLLFSARVVVRLLRYDLCAPFICLVREMQGEEVPGGCTWCFWTDNGEPAVFWFFVARPGALFMRFTGVKRGIGP